MGKGEFVPLGKVARCKVELLPPFSAKIKMHQATPPLLHTASCHGAKAYTGTHLPS